MTVTILAIALFSSGVALFFAFARLKETKQRLADATASFETQSGALATALKKAQESFAIAAKDVEKAHTSHTAQAEEIQLLKYERQFFGIFIDQFQLANPPDAGGHVDDLSDTALETWLGDAIVRTDVGVALLEFKKDCAAFRTELTRKPIRLIQAKAVMGDAEMGTVASYTHFAAWGTTEPRLVELAEYVPELLFRAGLSEAPADRVASRAFIQNFRRDSTGNWRYGARPRTFLKYVRFLIEKASEGASGEGDATGLLSSQAVSVICFVDGKYFHKTYPGYEHLFQALDPAIKQLQSLEVKETIEKLQSQLKSANDIGQKPKKGIGLGL